MTPAPTPRAAALRALLEAGTPQEPAPLALVRGVQRHRALLDALLARGGEFDFAKAPPPARMALRLAAFEAIFHSGTPAYALGAEYVALARAAAGGGAGRLVNAALRRVLPTLPTDAAALRASEWFAAQPPEIRWSVPPELLGIYHAAYGADGAAVLEALATREAPLWLRVNTLRASVAEAQARLQAEGANTEPGPAPLPALRWLGGALPWTLPGWAAGWLTVQDLAAQLAAELLAPQPGTRVLDLCAAPGGKTGHLWERLRGAGELVACEVDPARHPPLRDNLLRLHGSPPAIHLTPSTAGLPAAVFDAVLIDAPCQALGLIGRHPEIRWDGRLARQTGAVAVQRALLAEGARLLRPGGRLLWATCSPARAENEGVVRPFLAAHPGWQALPPPPALAPLLHAGPGPVYRTRPDRDGCDAFAYCLMQASTS